MTGALEGILAILVASMLCLVTAYMIKVRTDVADKRFLVRVFLFAILLRYSLAVVLNVFAADSTFAAAFWGDSSTYDHGGNQLSLKWSGEAIVTAPMAAAVSGYGWVYFVGAVYYIFGRNQLLIQLLNGLFGGLTILVIFATAAHLYGKPAARWAALFMAFFPQMVFWSTGMYKDPAILLCISVAMYAVVRLREKLLFSMIALFVLAAIALITLRFYVAYFVLFATLATFVFGQRRGGARMLITYLVLGLALVGALNVAVRRETLEQQTTYLSLERLQITREDQAMWGRSGFGQEYDVSTPAGALATLPIGLVYLLFAPFPWAASGLRQALVIPETLVWYALMPAFVRGVRIGLRSQFHAVLPIVVFAVSLTCAYALMQGNVGTAYRQRTQITMFFFIFMGVGIVERGTRKTSAGVPVQDPRRRV